MPSLSIIRRISDFPDAVESTILAIDDTLKYCHSNLADESYVAALVSAISDLKVSVIHFPLRSVADISLLGSSCLSWERSLQTVGLPGVGLSIEQPTS